MTQPKAAEMPEELQRLLAEKLNDATDAVDIINRALGVRACFDAMLSLGWQPPEKWKPLVKQLDEADRVIEAAIGDITYKEVDTNDCVGMLDRCHQANRKVLTEFRSDKS